MGGLGRLQDHSTRVDGAGRRCPSLADLSLFPPQPLSLGTASWRCPWPTPLARCGSSCSSSPARAAGCSSWLLASPSTSCCSCELAACRSAPAPPSSPRAGQSLPGLHPVRGGRGSPAARERQEYKWPQSGRIGLNTENQAPSGEFQPLPGCCWGCSWGHPDSAPPCAWRGHRPCTAPSGGRVRQRIQGKKRSPLSQLEHGKKSRQRNKIPSCGHGVGIHHEAEKQGAPEVHIVLLPQPGLGYNHIKPKQKSKRELARGGPNADHVSHQPSLHLGRLQAAAHGEQRLLFPLPAPRARAGSSPGCKDGGQ